LLLSWVRNKHILDDTEEAPRGPGQSRIHATFPAPPSSAARSAGRTGAESLSMWACKSHTPPPQTPQRRIPQANAVHLLPRWRHRLCRRGV